MNKYDIKKALECCANPSLSYCSNCPYNNKGEFSCRDGEMYKDALNLITKQEQKIKRLKDDYAKLQELFAQYQMASDKEIIAQKEEAKKRFENNMRAVLKIEKKQAVKEFAEKVKGKSEMFLVAKDNGVYGEKPYVSIEKIDELLKEYE